MQKGYTNEDQESPHLQDIIQKNLTTKIAKRNYFAEQISGPL
jgi:hypothetical protein